MKSIKTIAYGGSLRGIINTKTNQILEFRYISEALNRYKILNNNYWFQLTKRIIKTISYINLCIISVLFIWHVDYYSLAITLKRIYSDSFKSVYQYIWNTISKTISEGNIKPTKNEFIDSKRVLEFFPNLDKNPCETITDSINNSNYKEHAINFIKDNQYYIIGGVIFIITATGIYYFSNDIGSWIAASGVTTCWSRIKEYFSWGNDDLTDSNPGSPTITPNTQINSLPTPTWSPETYYNELYPKPQDHPYLTQPSPSPTASSHYPESPESSTGPNTSSLGSSRPSHSPNSSSPYSVTIESPSLPSDPNSIIIESPSTPSIQVTQPSPEIDATQIPLPDSPEVTRGSHSFTENRLERSASKWKLKHKNFRLDKKK
jgi:hypothetical protein